MTLPQKSLFIHDSIRANMLLWDDAPAHASRSPEETDALIEALLRKVGIWDALFSPKPSPSSSSSSASSIREEGSSSSSSASIPDSTEKGAAGAAPDKEDKKEEEAVTLDSPLNPQSRLSTGQQQLFCLARALLQRGDSQIVLMDEFTSSMDHETEMLVREIVARDLRGKTVIEVLHRLEHILDFDLVVVLDKGRVAEAGHPEELLQNEEGLLRDLYQSMRG